MVKALQAKEIRVDSSFVDWGLFPSMRLPPRIKIPEFQRYDGPALDWFMTLKAEDIPTWADLSRKFVDQYQFRAEAPPTLLELSTKEMAEGQKFEDYATKVALSSGEARFAYQREAADPTVPFHA
ncbi:hypothetical protein CRG98_050022 [Punica granatum]|uniref:Retrotransposon gag domain-containing protein n=1 Tax=Punica granatum TaxID=22663 RepID=A0A2I0GU28_PUNGR|nr:hypothetical protein CRG98_050022 [Punica granatum]